MIIRNIARPIFRSVSRSILRPTGENAVTRAINTARNALNIHPEQQTGSAYLVQKTPTLAGVVQDETPTRKDRTRLSCRASDFAVNQYFNGPVDIAGWTEFSISCWIRHSEPVVSMWAMGSFGATAANYAFNFGAQPNTKPRLIFYDNSGASDGKINFPANSTNDNEWHLLTATYDFATETMTGYIDGRDVTAASDVTAGTNGSINTTQNPNDFTIGTLIQNPTLYDWNGQLQQPLIYQGIWSAAQVRDLYLQQVDDIPITYGWFLDGDTASGLTSSSPALTPSNSPDIYENDAVPVDWLNEKGWNFGNSGRTTKSNESGDTLTFKIKTTTDVFCLLNDSDSSAYAAYFQGGAGSNCRVSASSVTIDGVEVGGLTADAAQAILCDDVEHEVVVSFNISSWAKYEWNNYVSGSPIYALDDGYCRLTHINGVAITADDIDFDNTTVIAPKRWDEELDSDGAAAVTSESFGVARRDGQLEDGACLEFTGTEYATNANLVGTETVTSSGGTSTPSISAGRIDFTAGTCWGLTLSNGSIYPIGEGAGTVAKDVVNDEPLALVNSPSWGNQSQYFWNENQGCGQYELITNGTFDSDISGWTDNSGGATYIDWDAGRLRLVGDGVDFVNADQQITTVVGEVYTLLYDRIAGSGSVACKVGTSLGAANLLNQSDFTPDSSFTLSFTATTTTTFVRFQHGSNSTNYIDNVSIKPTALIPALADGSGNDANGYPLTNPAGPWLYEGLGSTYVNFDVVANANQWLEQRWIDASFDGVTSYLDTANNFNWANAFDVAMRITQANIGTGYLVGSVANGAYSLQSNNLKNRAIINGSYDFTTAEFTENVEYLSEFSYTGGVGGTITVGIDGDSVSGVNNVVSVSQNFKLRIGVDNTLTSFSAISARGFTANNNGAEWVDMPLLGCSLDLANVNHGTDTDITYNRLTDVSYTAGDTVEQPFSVNDDTSGRVSELINFTFPVTTISNTPTINQTVYEDGNTITEDSILISES